MDWTDKSSVIGFLAQLLQDAVNITACFHEPETATHGHLGDYIKCPWNRGSSAHHLMRNDGGGLELTVLYPIVISTGVACADKQLIQSGIEQPHALIDEGLKLCCQRKNPLSMHRLHHRALRSNGS